MTQLLRDLLRELLTAEGAATIVAEAAAGADLIATVDASGARVVIFGNGGWYAITELEGLLAARPRTRLLSVADEGRATTLYALRPHKQELGEISPLTLRKAVTQEPWPGAP